MLLVAYKFPPMKSVSTLRTWGFYEHLGRHVDKVTVITTSNRRRLLVDDFDTGDAEVHEVGTYDYRRFLSGRVRPGSPSIVSEVRKVSGVGRLAGKLKSSFPTNYVFGEGGWTYIRNAVQKASQLYRESPFNIVLSSYPPYADHVVAYRLKERFPDLYWIADFRDLHIDPSLRNLWNVDYQKRVNRQILEKADLILTVSDGLAHHLRDFHPNVYVLRNGVRRRSAIETQVKDNFRLTYTGSMFRDMRKPEMILSAVRKLLDDGIMTKERVEVEYAGKDSAVWASSVAAYDLEDIFIDHGLVSSPRAEELQARSNVNLLLTYSTPDLTGNLTGKLYSYMAARNPIIAVVNGTRDQELEDVFRATNAGLVAYHEDIDGESSVADFIADLYTRWASEESEAWSYNEASMDDFYWDTSIDKLVKYLKSNHG